MKGITPIIGVIILLLIVIALAGLAYTYIFGIVGSQISNTIRMNPGSAEENTVIIMNMGTDPLLYSDLTLTVEGQDAPILNTGSIEPRSSVVLEFCPPATGNNLDVRIAGPSNTVNFKADISPYRVFISSTGYDGNDFVNLAGADTECQDMANIAGLGSSWKAWVSDSTTSASERLHHSTVPYRLLNCTKIADNWNDLTDGDIDAQINLDENRQDVAFTVRTGTYSNGSSAPTNCLDWTDQTNIEYSMGGHTNGLLTEWTQWTSLGCLLNTIRIYCFEQPA